MTYHRILESKVSSINSQRRFTELPELLRVELVAGGGGVLSDAPPSYESLFGRIRQKKETATSPFDFFTKLCYLLGGTS